MRLVLLTILIVTWFFTGLLLVDKFPIVSLWHTNQEGSNASVFVTSQPTPSNQSSLGEIQSASSERSLELELYEDPGYGFALAVPSGWSRIVAADAVSDSSNDEQAVDNLTGVGTDSASRSLEPGYAVGFESGHPSQTDFIDYILVEILPGTQSGLFDADPALRRRVVVDGRGANFDRLEITGVRSEADDVDLLVLQAELSGIGYTIGLYAIGKLVNEPMLTLVFEAMLQTFEVRHDPFTVG